MFASRSVTQGLRKCDDCVTAGHTAGGADAAQAATIGQFVTHLVTL